MFERGHAALLFLDDVWGFRCMIIIVQCELCQVKLWSFFKLHIIVNTFVKENQLVK